MADEWGLVVNEALAAGVPVLGSAYAQAVEELVEEGRTGWIFRPDHEDELYAALERFFAATESELNEMRVLARAKVIDLTPDAVVGPLVDAIRYARRGAPND
jgi:glycosyltransferase involved in cell wall biosynthesis